MQTIQIVFGVIAVLLLVTRFFGGATMPPSAQEDELSSIPSVGACKGTPIPVSYNYYGRVIEDFPCKGHCDTPHYILYANGLGAQCGLMPPDTFCSDGQEDAGAMCTPPTATTLK
jgi:hypothetical protein